MSERNGTNSPKGTRRSFSCRSTTSPSGPKAMATLWKPSRASSPSVAPTTTVASSPRASSATASPSGVASSGPSTSMTFSGHNTRSTGASMSSLASRWASNTSFGSVSRAVVPCSPPPCTSATRSWSPVSRPDGATAATATATTTTPARGDRRCPRPSHQRGQRHRDHDGDPADEQRPADPRHRGERTGDLADGEGRQRHAAEGPSALDRFEEHPRPRQGEPPAPPRRASPPGHHRGSAASTGAGDQPPGQGQLVHPPRRRPQQRDAEEPAPPEPGRRGRSPPRPDRAARDRGSPGARTPSAAARRPRAGRQPPPCPAPPTARPPPVGSRRRQGGGVGLPGRRGADEPEEGDDALTGRARRVAGEQRRRVRRALVGDVDAIGGDDLVRSSTRR